MNRTDWLRERRRINEERVDTIFAPIYDSQWGSYINPSHQAMRDRFLAACPVHAIILDAACGTGKYWASLLRQGHQVVGIDQSQQMLNVAHAKHPTVPIHTIGLQELDEHAAYDGIICIDAMENVFPEDWPLVLHTFAQALKPNGLLYLTVELEAPNTLVDVLQRGRQAGFPLVTGEVVQDGGYHYYPSIAQVRDWLKQAAFKIIDETEGDDYYHLLTRKQ